MVCVLQCKNGEELSYGYDALDGDFKKVKPLDSVDDGGVPIRRTPSMQGLKLEAPEFLPTKLRWDGPKRKLTDLQHGGHAFLAPQVFKDILERLEPGVHDFYPVELLWKDGSSAGERYWFYPQNRIGSVDPEKTTHTRHTVGRRLWDLDSNKSGKLVFSRAAIGGFHAWIDKLIPASSIVLVSETFKDALVEAKVTGVGFKEYEETD